MGVQIIVLNWAGDEDGEDGNEFDLREREREQEVGGLGRITNLFEFLYPFGCVYFHILICIEREVVAL